MQDDTIAHHAVMINRHAGINQAVPAHLGPFLHHSVCIDLRATAHFGMLAHIGKGTHIAVLGHMGRFGDAGQRMYALALGRTLLVEGEKPGHSLVGIVHTHHGGGNRTRRREVAVHQHDARSGFVEIIFVFGIGQEGQCALHALFNLGKSLNSSIGVTHNLTLQVLADLLRSKFHIVL